MACLPLRHPAGLFIYAKLAERDRRGAFRRPPRPRFTLPFPPAGRARPIFLVPAVGGPGCGFRDPSQPPLFFFFPRRFFPSGHPLSRPCPPPPPATFTTRDCVNAGEPARRSTCRSSFLPN